MDVHSPDLSPEASPLSTPDTAVVDNPEPAVSSPTLARTTSSPSTMRVPSLRSISDTPIMTPSSTPLGPVAAARKGPNSSPTTTQTPFASAGLPQNLQARLQAFHTKRLGNPPGNGVGSPPQGGMPPPGGMRVGPGGRPVPPTNWNSAPAVAGRPGMGAKPGGMAKRRNLGMKLSDMSGPPPDSPGKEDAEKKENKDESQQSMFDKYSQYVDAKEGKLKFAGKAVLHGRGVEFSSGSTFNIALDEVEKQEELGKGNYGTVYKVVHKGPPQRRGSISGGSPPQMNGTIATAGLEMAMKEIRLELDENKFAQIIMELDVLHRCRSPFIIDFYGAFFQEGAVYICMEYMNGGSIDKLYQGGTPENILRKIAHATVKGLKVLKDDHNIIHRDVKPTNILVNSRGDIKLCDFGVSGNLVASIAKTNIGCQSYMAPERISSGDLTAGSGGAAGTYGVQSDVWSLGLSILECAMGCYPYPPETYNNIFSQLSAIVDGDPPDLPESGFSPAARDFVRSCLHKVPKLRPSYADLLSHAWIAQLEKPDVIAEEPELEENEEIGEDEVEVKREVDVEVQAWVVGALERREMRQREGLPAGAEKPALHAAPLDAVPSPGGKEMGVSVEEIAGGVEGLKT